MRHESGHAPTTKCKQRTPLAALLSNALTLRNSPNTTVQFKTDADSLLVVCMLSTFKVFIHIMVQYLY